jgi:opacity protein-like surface antigen
MKRNAIFLGMLLSSSSFASSCPFEGIHAGINAGYTQSSVGESYLRSIFIPGNFNFYVNRSARLTDTIPSGGLALGYSTTLKGCYLLGLEGRANFQDFDTDISTVDFINSDNSLLETNHTIKLNQDYSLLARLGYVYEAKALFYGLIGANWGHFHISNYAYFRQGGGNTIGSLQGHDSFYQAGLLLGLGMEYLLLPCLGVSFEYNYINYRYLHYPKLVSSPLSLGGVVDDASLFGDHLSFKMQNNRGLVQLNYYFG